MSLTKAIMPPSHWPTAFIGPLGDLASFNSADASWYAASAASSASEAARVTVAVCLPSCLTWIFVFKCIVAAPSRRAANARREEWIIIFEFSPSLLHLLLLLSSSSSSSSFAFGASCAVCGSGSSPPHPLHLLLLSVAASGSFSSFPPDFSCSTPSWLELFASARAATLFSGPFSTGTG